MIKIRVECIAIEMKSFEMELSIGLSVVQPGIFSIEAKKRFMAATFNNGPVPHAAVASNDARHTRMVNKKKRWMMS